MDAKRVGMTVAAVAAVGALAAVVVIVRETPPPIAADADAAVEASAHASAEASADADVPVEAKTADAEARDSAVAAITTTTGTSTSTPPTTKDSGIETASPEAGVKSTATVNLDEGSSGKTIELAKGQSVVLMLGATPSSGFDWAVTKAPAALGSPTLGFIAGGDQTGAAGKRRIAWTLKDALPAGEHAVELGYARSFEPGVAPFKTFRFKVKASH